MANYTQSGYDPSLHGYWKGTIDGAPNFGYPVNYYYANTMRSIFIGFTNFFNDLKVIRYNSYGEPIKVIDVPIKFGVRNKSHDFRTEQESGDKYYISMPNLAFKLDNTEFDSGRAKGVYETRAFYNNDLENAGLDCAEQEMFWSDVQPVPHNINVTMEANCEKMSDAEQIFEQITVRFAPAAFFNIKEFWFFNKRRSIKMILNGCTWNIESDAMGEEEWRRIKLSFSFKIEAVLYKPIKDAQIIEKINTYLTLNKGDYIYHGVMFGNKDGSLTTPRDFSKIYNTKVGNSYVLDGKPETTYDDKISAYTTVYKYKMSEDLTTYDEDAKLLKKVVSTWIPSAQPVTGEPVKVFDETTQSYIMSSHVYSNEWKTDKYYEYLSGYGELHDNTVGFGHKVLYDQYGEPFSAYYSTYYEEGTYTDKISAYENNKADFYYRVNSVNGLRPDTLFSASKYNS